MSGPHIGEVIRIDCRVTSHAIEPISAPALPYILEELGLIDLAEVVHPGVRITELTSRNTVFRVHRVGGGGFFIKQPQQLTRATIQKLEAESIVTEHLTTAGLTGLPRLLAADHRLAALVYELTDGSVPDVAVDDDVSLCRTLGRALAEVHSIVAPSAIPTADLPVLAHATRWSDPGPDFAVSVALLQREPAIAQGYRWLTETWRHDAIIHGDVKPTNLLALPGGAIRLIDWELGGRGDRRWDLGMAIGYLLCEIVLRAMSTRDDDTGLAAPLARARAKTDALLRGYLDGAREESMTGIANEDLGRCAALALAQFVMALGRGARRPTRAMVQLAQIAVNLLQRPGEGLTTLFGEWPA